MMNFEELEALSKHVFLLIRGLKKNYKIPRQPYELGDFDDLELNEKNYYRNIAILLHKDLGADINNYLKF